MFEPSGDDWRCSQCGLVGPLSDQLPKFLFRPWHVLHGRLAVKAFVSSLGDEAHECLLALYVDADLQLLAVDTIGRGDASRCKVPFWKLIDRGHRLNAAGYILVHNHPGGDPRPSTQDVLVTQRLEDLSRDAEMHLLNHFVIAGDDMWIVI